MKDQSYKVITLILSIVLVLTGSLLGIVYSNIKSATDINTQKIDELKDKYSSLDKATGEGLVRIDGRLDNIEGRLGIPVTKKSAYIEDLKKQLAVPTKEL